MLQKNLLKALAKNGLSISKQTHLLNILEYGTPACHTRIEKNTWYICENNDKKCLWFMGRDDMPIYPYVEGEGIRTIEYPKTIKDIIKYLLSDSN